MSSHEALSKKKDDTLLRTTIYFGKKDGFLCEWVQSLPWGSFSFIVKEAVRAYINDDKEFTIPQFSYRKKEYKKSITMALSVNKQESDVYDYFTSLDLYNRANQIKNILRYYLTKDREALAVLNQPRRIKETSTEDRKEKRDLSINTNQRNTTKSENDKKEDRANEMLELLLHQSEIMNSGDYS